LEALDRQPGVVGGIGNAAKVGVVVGHQPGDRRGAVRHVHQELVAGAHDIRGNGDAQAAVGGGIAFHQAGGGDDLHETVLAADELAVAVGGQQRDVEHVLVGQLHAEHLGGLLLDLGPVAGAVGAVDQAAGGERLASDHRVLAQEHLVRRMRGVGLVLVDEGRGRVGVPVRVVVRRPQLAVGPRSDGVDRPRKHHEVGAAAGHVQGVVGQQGHEHRAAALGDQVQAVVEELAEDGHRAVERRRQPEVR